MKRMLFNATHSEELRVAVVDGQKLLDLDIETAGNEKKKSNIYKGKISRIEPGLEAAFVDYGVPRHGFLPFKEILRSIFKDKNIDISKAKIKDVIEEGQELLVQVEKDERGNKGAALTTFIGLAGRYLVLMPNNPRGGGVSRRIEGNERESLKEIINQLELPNGMSIIARTAGIGRSLDELKWDLNYLLQLWDAIKDASESQKSPFLIFQDGSLVIRAIRDYFHQDIEEILIDEKNIYEQAYQFMSNVMPENADRVKFYKETTPLFSRFQIEQQIESAFSREVSLPSGGSIVIDHTEAMVTVDVNSARSTRGSDIEETAYKTNKEAAEEISRQLRIRDIGGLIVVDFIDMENQKNQRLIEEQLKNLSLIDRARIQIGRISRFGLLELSRQRLRGVLGESSNITCPRCSGIGHIRSVESSALHILRAMEEESMKDGTVSIQAQVPLTVAAYLLNEKRVEIRYLEKRLGVTCVLIPNTNLETPNYSIKRVKSDDVENNEKPSYTILKTIEKESSVNTSTNKNQENSKPIVTVVNPEKAPMAKFSIISFIKNLFSPKKSNKKNSKFTNKRKYLKSKKYNKKRENFQSKNNNKRKINTKRNFKRSNKSSPYKTKSHHEINTESNTHTSESKKEMNHHKQDNSAINEINSLIEATSSDFDNSIKKLSNKASVTASNLEKNTNLSEEKVNYKKVVKESGLEMIETKEK